SGSYINHALTVNPHVYISCIKQFWNTAGVKRSGDITRLQALVDKKKIVISEAVVREILVGKGFSRVETPLFETMLVVRDIAEDAEAWVPAQGDDVHEHAAEEVATDVVSPTPTLPSPSSPIIPSSPPHQSPCPPQPQDVEGSSHLFQQVLDTCFALVLRVEGLENANAAQQLEIVKLKARGRNIVDMDQDEGIELVVDHEKDAEVQKAVEVVTTAKLITEVVTAAATQVVAANPEEELHTHTLAETPTVKDKGKGILIEVPKPMKKKDQVEMDIEYAKKLQEELDKEHEEAYKNIDWNAALDHVQSKEPQYIKRYHEIKKKPQSESEAHKNMISYLKNTNGYKMEFFKGKTYDKILSIFQARFDANMKFLFKSREEMEKEDEEIIKSINETPAQKAAKKIKLSEEAQEVDDLKKRLEIIQDKDDDVVVIYNKPKYKIIRADDTHHFYISFITLLKNFDKEDLETLWRIVKVNTARATLMLPG
nr:hypothetical protein [Tanacetum cinerariifolium]